MLPDSRLWYLSEETELHVFSEGVRADFKRDRFRPFGTNLKFCIRLIEFKIFVQESIVHFERESRPQLRDELSVCTGIPQKSVFVFFSPYGTVWSICPKISPPLTCLLIEWGF